MDDDAVCSLYRDNGFLFFNAEAKENTGENGTMDLAIMIYEGIRVKIRKIIISGNGDVPEDQQEFILNSDHRKTNALWKK